ncbi:MAG: gas vesicle protein [Deltaproteobacteria bacterium]|nr:gas vesicle protein [Deltaproteobacteria bacterium]
MKPARQIDYNLTEVLDRLLDKGMVINAELVISVAGIPLIGVTLTAAVAGMDTMLAYGVMEDMDRRVRERPLSVKGYQLSVTDNR